MRWRWWRGREGVNVRKAAALLLPPPPPRFVVCQTEPEARLASSVASAAAGGVASRLWSSYSTLAATAASRARTVQPPSIVPCCCRQPAVLGGTSSRCWFSTETSDDVDKDGGTGRSHQVTKPTKAQRKPRQEKTVVERLAKLKDRGDSYKDPVLQALQVMVVNNYESKRTKAQIKPRQEKAVVERLWKLKDWVDWSEDPVLHAMIVDNYESLRAIYEDLQVVKQKHERGAAHRGSRRDVQMPFGFEPPTYESEDEEARTDEVEEGERKYNTRSGGRGGEVRDKLEDQDVWSDEWEEEDKVEPKIGDGMDGGGFVLGDFAWGKRLFYIANEVLNLHFDEDIKMYAFKVSPKGYIYVRLDKLSNRYGCPSMEEIAKFNCLYKESLEEAGENGDIPPDWAVEVSSPGVERLLKVPDDLDRFKKMPMVVLYLEEDLESKNREQKDGVFLLESVATDAQHCVWKLANVKENRDPLGKGKPLNRKQKAWRLTLPFEMTKRVTLYVNSNP